MSADMPKMPEPFARISSVMGKVMLFDAPDFTMRKGDAVFTADQMREYAQEAARQAMERYNELLFAVGNKYPDETRHQTALRYIQQAEQIDASALIPQSEKRHG